MIRTRTRSRRWPSVPSGRTSSCPSIRTRLSAATTCPPIRPVTPTRPSTTGRPRRSTCTRCSAPPGRPAHASRTSTSATSGRTRTCRIPSRSSTRGRPASPIVYAIQSNGFDVITSADHVLTWGVGIETLRETAYRNLATWSGGIAWAEEADGDRRLLSSASGEGWDAGRILLQEVRDHLATSLGDGGARVLIGLPDRDLLVASRLAAEDADFADHFAAFVGDQCERRGRAHRSPDVRAAGRPAGRVRRLAMAEAAATGEGVRVAVDGSVATITLDRPDALNALTIPLKEALLLAIRRADRDPAVRAIVLTGAGRAFCAGQDLKERLEPDAPPLEDGASRALQPPGARDARVGHADRRRDQRRRGGRRCVARAGVRHPRDRRRGVDPARLRPDRPRPRQRRDVAAAPARRRRAAPPPSPSSTSRSARARRSSSASP